MIDIVILHKDRLDYLKRTLDYLWERTRTPYRISIIDNYSNKINRKYLLDLLDKKRIFNLCLNGQNVGTKGGANQAFSISTSQPFVLMPDDLLVPDVEPDWLHRLLEKFNELNEDTDPSQISTTKQPFGLLSLNEPTFDRDIITTKNGITLCKSMDYQVGLFNRESIVFLTEKDDEISSASLCFNILAKGFLVGILNDTYCQHIGRKSAFRGLYKDNLFDKKTFVKVNPKTLELNEKRDF